MNQKKLFYWVVIEDGLMFMHDPNGHRLGGEIWCRITDANMEIPKAIFMVCVNIAGSVEEMNERIKQLNSGK